METPPLPRYTREIPPEWPALAKDIKSLLPPDQTYADLVSTQTPYVKQSLNLVRKLKDEPAEANYYYGLGLIMCGFAQTLATPDARQTAVDLAARGIATRRGRSYPLSVFDFAARYLSPPFTAIATRASEQLPQHQRLLINTLGAVVLGRRANHNKDTMLTTARTDNAAQEIGNAAFAGMLIVLKEARFRQYGLDADPPVAATLGTKNFDTILSAKTALGFASHRVDELLNNVSRAGIVEVDASGRISRAQDSLTKNPGPLLEAYVVPRRASRLTCPALQVQGLIPLALSILPEIIEKTDEYIAAQNTMSGY